jgi:vacuole morphology and inheritance protein 14
VVNWYIVLFKNFDNKLIDDNKDIFLTLINSINFKFPKLVQKIIDLVCMLSTKNEEYFREVMRWLIQRFHNSKKEIDQDKLNQIITYLCNSIKPEKVFMEFATIFHKMNDLSFV